MLRSQPPDGYVPSGLVGGPSRWKTCRSASVVKWSMTIRDARETGASQRRSRDVTAIQTAAAAAAPHTVQVSPILVSRFMAPAIACT